VQIDAGLLENYLTLIKQIRNKQFPVKIKFGDTVTIRERDTMKQIIVNIIDLKTYLEENVNQLGTIVLE
jgi:hypothetical protein